MQVIDEVLVVVADEKKMAGDSTADDDDEHARILETPDVVAEVVVPVEIAAANNVRVNLDLDLVVSPHPQFVPCVPARNCA